MDRFYYICNIFFLIEEKSYIINIKDFKDILFYYYFYQM